MRRAALPFAAALACACAAPGPTEAERMACATLLAAAPEHWPQAMRAVLELGPDGAPALIESVRSSRDAPGRQAAVAALGALRNPLAIPLLEELLAADDPQAAEAALALGRLRADRASGLLLDAAADHQRSSAVRAAAAAALLDLGHVREAMPLVRAMLLADVPSARDLSIDHGLPTRTRWALQRHMLIGAIARLTGGETFGLDPDASWPALENGVAQLDAWIADHGDGPRR
jgi:HEAT repeat protein